MSENESESQYLTKLRRLWKGTLYIGIVASYIAILVWTVLLLGWQAGLLALGLLALSQLFRYIASEVDRIGWVIRDQHDAEEQAEGTTSLKRRLFTLLIFLVQLPNVTFVVYIYMKIGIPWSAALIVALIVIELLYQEIRRINRKVAYREASYGFQERSMLASGHGGTATHEGQDATLTDRLDRLEQLVDEGKITRTAYEKARDKYWIRHVMEKRE